MLGKEELTKFCCMYSNIKKSSLNDPDQLFTILTPCFSVHKNISSVDKLKDIKHFLANTSFSKLLTEVCMNQCDAPTTTPNIIYVLFWFTVLILIISSNLLVIVSVQRVHFLKHGIANLFIMSLAVSDIFVAAFIVPMKVKYTLLNSHFCSSITICRFYLTTDVAFFSTSVTHLLVIAFDRYMALNYPYKYPSWATRTRANIIIVCTWVYGIMWGLLSNFRWDNPSESSIIIDHYTCESRNKYFIYAMFILVFLIPVTLMGIIYSRILLIARRHAKGIATVTFNNNNSNSEVLLLEIPKQSSTFVPKLPIENGLLAVEKPESASSSRHSSISTASGHNGSHKHHHNAKYRKMVFKATKTVATVYGAFVITWSPLWIISIITIVCKKCLLQNETSWYYVVFVELLPILSSLLNPCIYALMNKQYRKAFRIILKFGFLSKGFSCVKRQHEDEHHDRTLIEPVT